MKESLRMHPPLTSMARKLETDLEVEGHFIPKNTLILLVMQITHIDQRT